MKCKNCGKEIDYTQYNPKYGSGEFCSSYCSSSYTTKFDNKQEIKWARCCKCGKDIRINKRASPKFTKCKDCKKKKICKVCGQEKPCLRPDICKKHQILPKLIQYFGMDENKIGSLDIYEEFDRVRNILIEDYGDFGLSIPDIADKYGHENYRNLGKILKSLQIDTRDFSQSSVNTVLRKPETITSNLGENYRFQRGGHKTGSGENIFYRSSYELSYARYLDEQKICYDMESLRILYGDSQKLMQRVAIPDFYLPEYNTIVEVKSSGTYDKQNMKDRVDTYKQHGYNVELIYEGEKYTL